MSLPISIPEAGEPNETEETFTPDNVYLETLLLALESPNGVAVDTNTKANATALRHRFYRTIQEEKAKGNTSLRACSISIKPNEGKWMLVIKTLPFKVRIL